jgi:hypothetical protein
MHNEQSIGKSGRKFTEGPFWRAAREYGFDMSLIDTNLRLSPLQRIRNHQRALDVARALRNAMEKSHARK